MGDVAEAAPRRATQGMAGAGGQARRRVHEPAHVSVVHVMLPFMERGLGASVETVQWGGVRLLALIQDLFRGAKRGRAVGLLGATVGELVVGRVPRPNG